MIQVFPLSSGVTLRCFRDARFKQGCLSIQLVRTMDASEAAMNALLPSVLLRGTRRCPDMCSITMALDDLYGAAVSPLVRRVGDYQTTGLYCSFMDERFALPGDRVLEPMAEFLRELLLDSPTENGAFLGKFVESEKRNLISTIESNLNDKQTYAMGRLLELMCREDSFGLPRLGKPEQVAAITPEGLYNHYQRILRESPIQLFYVGSREPEKMAALLRPLFSFRDRVPKPLPHQSDLRESPVQNVTERMDVTQSKLCMGFTTPITNRAERHAAMQLMNQVFGGGLTSKLFTNVREKQSLCYSIGSGYYSSKGIITVSAGIDSASWQRVHSEVLRQLSLCARGQISKAELLSARQGLLSALRSAHDSPGAIEGYYSNGLLSGREQTPQEYIREIQAVTPEEVQAAAQTVKLHSTYFLTEGREDG